MAIGAGHDVGAEPIVAERARHLGESRLVVLCKVAAVFLGAPVELDKIPVQRWTEDGVGGVVAVGAEGGVVRSNGAGEFSFRRLVGLGTGVIVHFLPCNSAPEGGEAAEAGDRGFADGDARVPAGDDMDIVAGSALQPVLLAVHVHGGAEVVFEGGGHGKDGLNVVRQCRRRKGIVLDLTAAVTQVAEVFLVCPGHAGIRPARTVHLVAVPAPGLAMGGSTVGNERREPARRMVGNSTLLVALHAVGVFPVAFVSGLQPVAGQP